PYSVSSHDSLPLRQAVCEFAAKNPVDLWQAEWTPYLRAFRDLKNPRTLAMAHNVETLIWKRYHETEKHALKRWYIGTQWRKFRNFEREAFAKATRVVACTPEDADLIRREFGVSKVEIVDNGIDRTHYESLSSRRKPENILFLGTLDWRPNTD